MDTARIFLQMGYIRSRHFANHKNSKKYDDNREERDRVVDEEKARSAKIFEI